MTIIEMIAELICIAAFVAAILVLAAVTMGA
jgi:hypothetical protein